MAPFSGHSHGGEVYALARQLHTSPDKLMDLSSNTNIFAYHLTEELVKETPYPFLHYPDTSASALTEAIAAQENTSPTRILPGNGGAELIWLALQALAPRKVLCIGPIFSEYITACHAFDIPYEIVTPDAENDFICSPDDLEKIWETDADLVILCTPNNPAGVTYPNIANIFYMLRAPRVLIDNSYKEFLYGTPAYEENSHQSYQASLRQGVSLLTLHSFTKFFCCPGIRLGYLQGDKTVLNRIASLRPAWTISPFAQIMGQKLLQHIESYRETIPAMTRAVEFLAREMRLLDCMNSNKVFEGTSFVCAGLAPRYNAGMITKGLLTKRFIVRNCDTIPGMPQGYIRVQARFEEDSIRLLEALSTIHLDIS